MSDPVAAAPISVIQQIPVDQIKPSRHQARKAFDEEGIKSLAESIKLEGLIQPIAVRQVDGGYELVSGERRLRAVKLLSLPTIEAKIIQPVSEGEAAAKGLIENLQREDLNPIEEAESFAELGRLDPGYWTREQIGLIAGHDKGYVSRSISLLNLPESIMEKLRRRNFSRSIGIELLRLPDQESQLKAAKSIEKGLNREDARKLVDGILAKAAGKTDPANNHDAEPEASFKFSGKAMDAWVSFSGHYPIIGNWDDFVLNLRNAYEVWRAKGMKGGKKAAAAAKADAAVPETPAAAVESAVTAGHPTKSLSQP